MIWLFVIGWTILSIPLAMFLGQFIIQKDKDEE